MPLSLGFKSLGLELTSSNYLSLGHASRHYNMSQSSVLDRLSSQLLLKLSDLQHQPVPVTLGLIVLGLVAHVFYQSWTWHRTYKLPRTIPGRPVLGNIFQVPYPSGMWLKSLAEKHGEM